MEHERNTGGIYCGLVIRELNQKKNEMFVNNKITKKKLSKIKFFKKNYKIDKNSTILLHNQDVYVKI